MSRSPDGTVTQDDIVDAIDETARTVTLRNDLPWAPTGTVALVAKTLTAAASIGTISIALDNRLGLAAGDAIRIGADEIATIRSIPGERGPAPDAGAVLLTQPLAAMHHAGDIVRRQTVAVDATRQPVFTVLATPRGSSTLLVTDGTGYVAGDVLQLTLADRTRVTIGSAAIRSPRRRARSKSTRRSTSAQPERPGARIRTWEWRNQNPLPYHDEIVAEIAIKAFAARRLNG